MATDAQSARSLSSDRSRVGTAPNLATPSHPCKVYTPAPIRFAMTISVACGARRPGTAARPGPFKSAELAVPGLARDFVQTLAILAVDVDRLPDHEVLLELEFHGPSSTEGAWGGVQMRARERTQPHATRATQGLLIPPVGMKKTLNVSLPSTTNSTN